MPAWDNQDEAVASQGFKPSCCEGAAGANSNSCQPCGCDPGCKPRPHYCALHQPGIDADHRRARLSETAQARQVIRECTKSLEELAQASQEEEV